MLQLQGNGTFIVAGGRLVAVNGTAIKEEQPTNYNKITLIVSGNGKIEVSGNGANAINAIGDIEIKDNAYLSSTTGETINQEIIRWGGKGTVRVSGGTIVATSENAIITRGDTAEIIITGGYIANDATGNYPTVYAQGSESSVYVSGTAIVEAKGKGSTIFSQDNVKVSGNAIVKSNKGGYENSAAIEAFLIEISENAKIIAANTFAIYNKYGFCTTTVKGGMVFAYGSQISDIIHSEDFTLQDFGIVLAWNKDAGDTIYERLSTKDIFVQPDEAMAHWDYKDGKAGIAYANGTNTGFIPIDSVSIEGMGNESITNYELQITVYPNPTTGELYIQSSKFKVQRVEVYDVYGRKIKHSSAEAEPQPSVQSFNPSIPQSFNISVFPAGVYFVKITTEAGVVVKKIIKK